MIDAPAGAGPSSSRRVCGGGCSWEQRKQAPLAFVEARERNRGKAQEPEPIVNGFKRDVFAGQCMRQKRRAARPLH